MGEKREGGEEVRGDGGERRGEEREGGEGRVGEEGKREGGKEEGREMSIGEYRGETACPFKVVCLYLYVHYGQRRQEWGEKMEEEE